MKAVRDQGPMSNSGEAMRSETSSESLDRLADPRDDDRSSEEFQSSKIGCGEIVYCSGE